MLAICDRCGFKYQHGQLAKEWTGHMVCKGPGTNDCFDRRHPQEFVRGVVDRQGVRPNMRPQPVDTFIYLSEDNPPGFAWLVDDAGNFILDDNGQRLLVEMP